jgi:hypothetical protein
MKKRIEPDGTSEWTWGTSASLDEIGRLKSVTAVLVRTSFDAWGGRRDDDWNGAPSSTEYQQIASSTRHGFTGHEMLDNIGLVHMNGRVYDPATALRDRSARTHCVLAEHRSIRERLKRRSG